MNLNRALNLAQDWEDEVDLINETELNTVDKVVSSPIFDTMDVTIQFCRITWNTLNSMSKYDKSQGLLAIHYDRMIMKSFGIQKYYRDLWFNGHFLTKIYDPTTKIKALIPFQRSMTSVNKAFLWLSKILRMGLLQVVSPTVPNTIISNFPNSIPFTIGALSVQQGINQAVWSLLTVGLSSLWLTWSYMR
ncbi:hypothetical protein A3Q56_06057 [Intoshia linei]|uniref:RNA-dependent RNA polymerase alsuviricetes domain-containing protein n=1 Tax=Intoshia linei TaxID=1819745 RepID=A0A177AXS9_9BILA|nr:hypothetical protein A3Q56_06057 [Intoshia linei]